MKMYCRIMFIFFGLLEISKPKFIEEGVPLLEC